MKKSTIRHYKSLHILLIFYHQTKSIYAKSMVSTLFGWSEQKDVESLSNKFKNKRPKLMRQFITVTMCAYCAIIIIMKIVCACVDKHQFDTILLYGILSVVEHSIQSCHSTQHTPHTTHNGLMSIHIVRNTANFHAICSQPHGLPICD